MKKFLPGLVFLALLCIKFSAFSQTNVSGNITANTTWTKANSPYVLIGTVGIPSAYTLTVEPGVTIKRTSDYQILINGTVVMNGTATDSIVFQSGPALGGGTASQTSFFVEFQKSNLSNSNLSYVTFHNDSGNGNNIRLGNESEFSQTSPKNSGTLHVSKSNLSYGYTATKGYQAANSLDIDNCLIISGNVFGYYPRSEKINVSNSSIYNSTVTSDSYNGGITLTKCYARNTKFKIGCCEANINFANSKIEDSQINDGGGAPVDGPNSILNSVFLNSTISNFAAAYTISDSKFIITKPISNTISGNNYILILGNARITNCEFLNASSNLCSGLYLSGNNGYIVGGSNLITGNVFTNLYDDLYILNFASITPNSNNFINTGRYYFANYSLQNFTASNNYFTPKAGKTIDDMIFDSNDDLKYGLVTYKPFSTLPTGIIITSPANVYKTSVNGGVSVTWDKNQETNIKNYKVYWGNGGTYVYLNSAVIAASDNQYTIAGAAITDSIAVTALNTNSTGVDDQLNGSESWYAYARLKPPVITSFTPLAAGAGTTVTITGTDFTAATAVKFGGTSATSYNVVSPTTVTAVLGAGTSGSIAVTTGGGTATLTGFTFIPAPQITGITPAQAGAGATITITGTNFTGTTAVSFGGVPAASFNVVSATSITAVVGSGASNNVSVTTPGGVATKTGFVFVPAPTIISFTPTSAGANNTVTITGTNFTGVTSVSIGGVAASSFSVQSSTSITAIVASLAAGGNISVTTVGGQVSAAGFTFVPAPTITSLSANTGKAGSTITITGANFVGITGVSFGGSAASSFTVVSPTSITAVVGNGTSGAITVTGQYGVASFSGFAYVPVPVISGPVPAEIVAGEPTILAATNNASYLYQWYKDGVLISGETNYALIARATGSYTVVITLNGISQTSLPFVLHASFISSNFKVATLSATCKGSTNGAITITAAGPLSLNAIVTGNGVNSTLPFNGSSVTFQNLAAGTYNVCISSTTVSYQQCYTVVITEPKDLALYTAVDKNTNTLNLTLTGADLYNVELNGVKYTSSSGILKLQLSKGRNDLLVSSDKACQGIIEKHITITDDIIAYPNPFGNTLVLNLGDKVINKGTIQIFNSFGKTVLTQPLINQSGELSLDTSGLAASQIYILKLSFDNSEFINKINKK